MRRIDTAFKNLELIAFAFDAVLCNDHYYNALQGKYQQVLDYIEEKILSSNSDIVNKWKRGEKSSEEINKQIAGETGIDFSDLNLLFEEGLKSMKIDEDLLEFIMNIKSRVKTVLLTDNIDVFDTIIVPYKKLDTIFSLIINSSNFGCRKYERQGFLFDIALNRMNHKNYKTALLVDNSDKSCAAFKRKGGYAYRYHDKDSFMNWAGKNISSG